MFLVRESAGMRLGVPETDDKSLRRVDVLAVKLE